MIKRVAGAFVLLVAIYMVFAIFYNLGTNTLPPGGPITVLKTILLWIGMAVACFYVGWKWFRGGSP